MKKKQILIVTGIGTMIGAGIITNMILKKSAKAKKEEELLVEQIREYANNNKCSIHDFETHKYVKGVLLNGKNLSDEQIEKLFEKAANGGR